jgi:hypothetical protein
MDFIQALIELSNGQVAHDLHRDMEKVLAAVRDTGKKGKLTLTLDIEPQKIKDFKVTQVKITGTCKILEPTETPDSTIFHLLDDATLSRDDPRQIAMELEVQNAGKKDKQNGN